MTLSLVVTSIELPVPMTSVDNEGAIALLLHQPGVDELRHETRRHFAGLMVCLQLSDLLLELLNHVVLGLGILFFGSRCFFVSSNLSHGSAPLALRLQHVGSLTLGRWRKKRQCQ